MTRRFFSRVANISEFLSAPITMDELRERILARIVGTGDRAQISTLALDEGDWQAARELLGRKYGTATWNYGENPRSNVQRDRRFPGGEIDVRIDAQDGRSTGIRIFGDFMGRRDVGEFEARLCGVLYERDAIMDALAEMDLADFFTGIGRDEVLSILCP